MSHLPWILRAQGVPEEGRMAPDEAEPKEEAPGRRIVAGTVATVNLVDKTCTTTDGLVIRLGARTAEVADALTLGARVQIDAEGIPTADGLIVTEVWIRPD